MWDLRIISRSEIIPLKQRAFRREQFVASSHIRWHFNFCPKSCDLENHAGSNLFNFDKAQNWIFLNNLQLPVISHRVVKHTIGSEPMKASNTSSIRNELAHVVRQQPGRCTVMSKLTSGIYMFVVILLPWNLSLKASYVFIASHKEIECYEAQGR